METAPTPIISNHRRQLRIAFAASVATLLLAFAPRHERALFVVHDPGIAALTAVVPPLLGPDVGRYLLTIVDPRNRRGFVPRLAKTLVGPLVPENPFVPEAMADPAEPNFGAAPAYAAALPNSGSYNPLSLGDPGGFLPTTPLSFGPFTTSPVGQIDPGTPIVPVPGVPEPSTWLTMIIGFLGVGLVLRNRRSRLFEARLVAHESHRFEA